MKDGHREEISADPALEKAIFEYAPDAFYLNDLEGRFVDGNRAAERISGYCREELRGKSFLSLKLLSFRDIPKAAMLLARNRKGEPTGPDEFMLNRKDRTRISVEINTFPVKVNNRSLVLSIARDITERKREKDDLAAEKERLAVTLHGLLDGVIATDAGGKVVLMNKKAEEMTGWTQAEAAGLAFKEVFCINNERTREKYADPLDKIKKAETGQVFTNHTILVARDGAERTIEANGAGIHNRKVDMGSVVIFRDISEKRKIEEEMLKTQRLESIGVFAGGIAHDFNNILTVILGNLTLIRKSSDQRENLAMIEDMEKAAIQARNLTQQLLLFSKGNCPVKKTTSLSQLIKDSADFALRGSNVKCEFRLADNLLPVEADEGQINQVINNLVMNAAQAMPSGGLIIISAENYLKDGKNDFPLKHGKYVRLTVKDQGVGIIREHLSRIFDPYFTTKSSGNGLGLTTVYSIIKKHGGYITAESVPGSGAAFYIFLPASERPEPAKDTKVSSYAARGTGRILVMDDEKDIRVILGRMLKTMGYRAAFSENGSDLISAYRQAQQTGDPFDAVIMDLTIPGGISSCEALRELRGINPGIKAIVSSGYSNGSVMEDFSRHGFSAAVAKPYTADELSAALIGVLNNNA